MSKIQTYSLSALVLLNFTTFGQRNDRYWLSFVDRAKNKCGYINQNGDTVVQADKYNFCFTDTFRTYAIVLDKNSEFIAIDRRQNVLYEVFPFDNGPDYPSDGLFRIIKNKKIGYADELTGNVAIKPQFDCAFPFENGMAKVGLNCVTHSEGEHHYWTSNTWMFINRKGRKISPQKN